MEYTVLKLARLAGISSRTLRYYDEIGLLKPERLSQSGYRIYGQKQLDLLQQILFYRELGFELDQIQDVLSDPAFDVHSALESHLKALYERRNRLDSLIQTVKKTLRKEEGNYTMTDQEKFKGFIKAELDKNEAAYGKEIRDKYGDQAVEASNQKFAGLTEEEYNQMNELGDAIRRELEEAVVNKESPEGEKGRKIASMHREWLTFTWPAYSAEAHAGLVRMYTEDPRFTAYYDENTAGCAAFLRDAVISWLS
ncbi:MerR family transcriptional regulator [Anaerolentibacter hominis]|uniref:MerR family transcriptional regulator n=1 Tax=Anaerolentibacter hominis TaxID=3079009 RepID=UPI0031B86F9D